MNQDDKTFGEPYGSAMYGSEFSITYHNMH